MPTETNFRVTQKKIIAARQQRAAALMAQAHQKALSLAELLKTHYQASEVLLFGSLAKGTFQAHSDLDLLVKGFQGSYWEMLIRAEEVARPFPLNIVCHEEASPALVEEAKISGVIL